MGRILWEGRAELRGVQANRTLRSILPLPDVMRSAGPGAYLVVLRSADDAARPWPRPPRCPSASPISA